MDFTGRSSQPQPAAPNSGSQFNAANNANNNKRSSKPSQQRNVTRWGAGVLGLLVLLLVVAVIVVIGFGGHDSEGTYVDKGKLQAVFLNTGQVYFGDIKTINTKYFVLDNIYYLQTANGSTSSTTSSNSNSSVSLVKLGCELHAPYDQMIINRDQITFWENLNSDGQVAKAVATFQKDNPNGQKCSDQSSAPNSQTNVQGSTNSSSSTTNNTNTTNSTSTTQNKKQ